MNGEPINNPPIVTITSPPNDTVYTEPADIVIQANASDSDGHITKVEFFEDSNLLGCVENSPYEFSWDSVTAGNYTLTARAIDDKSDTTESDPVTIIVQDTNGGDPSLVCHLTFDEGTGTTAYDVSGYGNDGTIINGGTYSDNCKEGSYSLELDGTNQYVNLGNPQDFPEGDSARTICAWAYPTVKENAWRWVVFYGKNTTSQGMGIGFGWGHISGSGYNNEMLATNVYNANNWYHVALTYDGTTARLYINGNPWGAGQTKNWDLTLNAAYVGRKLNGLEYWKGLIDDVRIYNRALSETEIEAIMNGEVSKRIGEEDVAIEMPTTFCMEQNYPNPFNPITNIRYTLPEDVHVTLIVYDMMGRELVRLLDQQMEAGYHEVVWNGRNQQNASVSSGIYLIRIQAGDFVSMRKMLFLK